MAGNLNAARSLAPLANFPLRSGGIVRWSVSAAEVHHGDFVPIDAQNTVRIGHRSHQLRVGLVDASHMMHLLQQQRDRELVRVVVLVLLAHEKEEGLGGVAAYDGGGTQLTRALCKNRRRQPDLPRFCAASG